MREGKMGSDLAGAVEKDRRRATHDWKKWSTPFEGTASVRFSDSWVDCSLARSLSKTGREDVDPSSFSFIHYPSN